MSWNFFWLSSWTVGTKHKGDQIKMEAVDRSVIEKSEPHNQKNNFLGDFA